MSATPPATATATPTATATATPSADGDGAGSPTPAKNDPRSRFTHCPAGTQSTRTEKVATAADPKPAATPEVTPSYPPGTFPVQDPNSPYVTLPDALFLTADELPPGPCGGQWRAVDGIDLAPDGESNEGAPLPVGCDRDTFSRPGDPDNAEVRGWDLGYARDDGNDARRSLRDGEFDQVVSAMTSPPAAAARAEVTVGRIRDCLADIGKRENVVSDMRLEPAPDGIVILRQTSRRPPKNDYAAGAYRSEILAVGHRGNHVFVLAMSTYDPADRVPVSAFIAAARRAFERST
jgi:hypothetical protein